MQKHIKILNAKALDFQRQLEQRLTYEGWVVCNLKHCIWTDLFADLIHNCIIVLIHGVITLPVMKSHDNFIYYMLFIICFTKNSINMLSYQVIPYL